MIPHTTIRRLVCFGDSITAGDFVEKDCCWVHHIAAVLEPQGVQVINRGCGGDTTAGAVERLATDVLSLLPAVVLIQFGYNDSKIPSSRAEPQVTCDQYVHNLKTVVSQMCQGGGHPLILINYLPDRPLRTAGNGRSYNENFLPYDRALRQFVHEHNLHAIDMSAIQAATDVMSDGLHLSVQGHRHYAAIVLGGLRKVLAW